MESIEESLFGGSMTEVGIVESNKCLNYRSRGRGVEHQQGVAMDCVSFKHRNYRSNDFWDSTKGGGGGGMCVVQRLEL